jgi:hypothetical protein
MWLRREQAIWNWRMRLPDSRILLSMFAGVYVPLHVKMPAVVGFSILQSQSGQSSAPHVRIMTQRWGICHS